MLERDYFWFFWAVNSRCIVKLSKEHLPSEPPHTFRNGILQVNFGFQLMNGLGPNLLTFSIFYSFFLFKLL